MPVAIGVVTGALVAAWLWSAGGSMFGSPALQRQNYRGAQLATAVGVLVPVTVVLVTAGVRVVVLALDAAPPWGALATPTIVAVSGFALLGLFDDVVGAGQSGGFRQHLGALARGQVTSGVVKLFGGAGLGVFVAGAVASGDGGVVGTLRDGAVVALAANLANLFDRAPGRVIKVTSVAFAGAWVVARTGVLAAPAVGIGAGLGLVVPDLRERMMLGDAGANPLGALCGLAWLVALSGATGRWVLLAALVALNVLSEVVSFSRVIDSVAPLRWFDRLGSLRP